MSLSSAKSTNPTIVLVPGCWHTAAHYKESLDLLQNAGYPTKNVHLPSLNSSDAPHQTVTADIDCVRETILPLIDQGENVILLMHSYGGCPGAAAAKGLSQAERPGLGAVIGLIFFAGYLVQAGHSVVQTAAEPIPWLIDEVSEPTFFFCFRK